ncbi:MAG: OsmC family protein [Hyphomonadaceae bacterium]
MSQAACSVMAPAIVNGVNVTALMETITAVKADPGLAHFNFRLANTWAGGDKNRSVIGQFSGARGEHRTEKTYSFDNGEPPVLLGKDEAPNPVEWLIHALIGCMTTTAVYHAAARGIEIEAIESKLDGDIDIRGLLGISNKVRPGYSAIRVKMRVKTKAAPETIKALTAFSPVHDVVSRSTPVELTVETY